MQGALFIAAVLAADLLALTLIGRTGSVDRFGSTCDCHA